MDQPQTRNLYGISLFMNLVTNIWAAIMAAYVYKRGDKIGNCWIPKGIFNQFIR